MCEKGAYGCDVKSNLTASEEDHPEPSVPHQVGWITKVLKTTGFFLFLSQEIYNSV